MWRLKSGLLRCRSCYVRMLTSNRNAREDEQGVCAWPRLEIDPDAEGVSAPASDRPWRAWVQHWQSETEWYR